METEASKEVMRTLETKFGMSELNQRVILSEKIGRVHEHNNDIFDRK